MHILYLFFIPEMLQFLKWAGEVKDFSHPLSNKLMPFILFSEK